MEQRKLGALQVSAIGYGAMGLSHAYGAPCDEKAFQEVVAANLAAGVTFFDTAEIYGTNDDPHHNERLLGPVLKPHRAQIVLASKFGIEFDLTSPKLPHPLVANADPRKIKSALEGSLKRLHTDYLDLYYQHRHDPKVEPEAVAEVMAGLIKEGKIRAWGVSEAPADYIRRAHAVCPISAVQNRYSMLARQHEALFPLLSELNIGLVAFSPLANGILSGSYDQNSHFDPKYDYRATMPQFQQESYAQNQALFALLSKIAQEHEATMAQLSLAWVMAQAPWIVPIPGSRNLERIKENAGAAQVKLTYAEVQAITDALERLPHSAVYGGAPTKIHAD